MKSAIIPPMRRLCLLLMLLPLACDSPPHAKLEGTRWKHDAIALEFTSNGHVSYRSPEFNYTGTYTYGPGDLVHWHLDHPISESLDMYEHVSLSGDTLTLTDSGVAGKTLTFDRIK